MVFGSMWSVQDYHIIAHYPWRIPVIYLDWACVTPASFIETADQSLSWHVCKIQGMKINGAGDNVTPVSGEVLRSARYLSSRL